MFGKVGSALRTFSELKGLPVIHVKSGAKMGEVFDLSVSSEGKVEGLLVKRHSLIRKKGLIKVDEVLSFGVDGVMVEDPDVLEPVKTLPNFTLEHQESLNGKMMISEDGEELGLLQDVYFLEEMGTIVGYELTDGFFSDITDGKRVVKAVNPPAIGKDAIIVNVKNIVNEVSIDDDMPQLSE
jgi:uncharacterized protein YrrD